MLRIFRHLRALLPGPARAGGTSPRVVRRDIPADRSWTEALQLQKEEWLRSRATVVSRYGDRLLIDIDPARSLEMSEEVRGSHARHLARRAVGSGERLVPTLNFGVLEGAASAEQSLCFVKAAERTGVALVAVFRDTTLIAEPCGKLKIQSPDGWVITQTYGETFAAAHAERCEAVRQLEEAFQKTPFRSRYPVH